MDNIIRSLDNMKIYQNTLANADMLTDDFIMVEKQQCEKIENSDDYAPYWNNFLKTQLEKETVYENANYLASLLNFIQYLDYDGLFYLLNNNYNFIKVWKQNTNVQYQWIKHNKQYLNNLYYYVNMHEISEFIINDVHDTPTEKLKYNLHFGLIK